MDVITLASPAIAQLNYGLYIVKNYSLPRSLEFVSTHYSMQEIRRPLLQNSTLLL